MSREQAILRHQFADYLNCGTADNPDWQLMGYGFTAINETFGASTESTKYVNDKAESTDVVSYSSQFPFTAHMIKSEVAIEISGDNKQELSGNLNGRGDPIDGTFNTTTKAFTAT